MPPAVSCAPLMKNPSTSSVSALVNPQVLATNVTAFSGSAIGVPASASIFSRGEVVDVEERGPGVPRLGHDQIEVAAVGLGRPLDDSGVELLTEVDVADDVLVHGQ